MKNKIITIFLIIFFTITVLNLNEVLGVGIVSQCWTAHVDGDTKPDLVFRMFVSPHNETVESYYNKNSTDYVEGGAWKYKYNGKEYTSKWVNLTNGEHEMTGGWAYQTIGFAFHTEQMGDYSKKNNEYYIGYRTDNNKTKINNEIEPLRESIEASVATHATPRYI